MPFVQHASVFIPIQIEQSYGIPRLVQVYSRYKYVHVFISAHPSIHLIFNSVLCLTLSNSILCLTLSYV